MDRERAASSSTTATAYEGGASSTKKINPAVICKRERRTDGFFQFEKVVEVYTRVCDLIEAYNDSERTDDDLASLKAAIQGEADLWPRWAGGTVGEDASLHLLLSVSQTEVKLQSGSLTLYISSGAGF